MSGRAGDQGGSRVGAWGRERERKRNPSPSLLSLPFSPSPNDTPVSNRQKIRAIFKIFSFLLTIFFLPLFLVRFWIPVCAKFPPKRLTHELPSSLCTSGSYNPFHIYILILHLSLCNNSI